MRDCGVHLPLQRHQEYIYIQNSSHGKLVGNWLKNSYTAKAAKKSSPNKVGQKKSIRSGPPPLRRIWKGEKSCIGGSSSRVQAVRATVWVSQAWGTAWRRQALLANGRTAETHRRAAEAQTQYQGVCVCRSWQTEPCTGSCHLAALLNPNGANAPVPLTPHHSFVWDLGQLALRFV